MTVRIVFVAETYHEKSELGFLGLMGLWENGYYYYFP